MSEDLRIISADDHVNPPPTIYAERVPAEWRDRMPRIERRGDRDMLVFEGKERPFSLLEGSAGVASKDVQLLAKTKGEGRKGGWIPTLVSRTWISTASTPRCCSAAERVAASRSAPSSARCSGS